MQTKWNIFEVARRNIAADKFEMIQGLCAAPYQKTQKGLTATKSVDACKTY